MDDQICIIEFHLFLSLILSSVGGISIVGRHLILPKIP